MAEEEKTAIEEQRPAVKAPQGRGILLPLLTGLLAVVGVGELALGGYIGLGAYRGALAQSAYEAQQAAVQSEAGKAQGPAAYNFASPWHTVVNGEIIWALEDEQPAGGSEAEGLPLDQEEPKGVPWFQRSPPRPAWAYGSSYYGQKPNEQSEDTLPVSENQLSDRLPTENQPSGGGAATAAGTQSGGSATIAPSAESLASGVTISPNQEKRNKPNASDNTIVYVSNRSNTIHSIPDCSNMKNYVEMTKTQADANKYEYCKNCW